LGKFEQKSFAPQKIACSYAYVSHKRWSTVHIYTHNQYVIQAGNGAKADTIIGVAAEDRGISWSVGGDGTLNDTLTLTSRCRNCYKRFFAKPVP